MVEKYKEILSDKEMETETERQGERARNPVVAAVELWFLTGGPDHELNKEKTHSWAQRMATWNYSAESTTER